MLQSERSHRLLLSTPWFYTKSKRRRSGVTRASRFFAMWGRGKKKEQGRFFCCPLFPFLCRNVDLCQRFFRLTLFQRSFNWRLSPISTPELAQSVFPLPSPSSQLVEVFSLASRGRGWGRESLPHFQQCSRERSRKIHAPGISWGPLGHLSNCQFQKWGIFKSGIIMVVVTFSITVKHLKRIKTKFVHPLERKKNHENVSLL